jgi:hypothetical protein
MRILHIFLFSLLSFSIQAQAGGGSFDKSSAEITFGYSQPLNYFKGDNFGTNFGLNNVKLAYRYMITRDLGVRTSYVFNRYRTAAEDKTTSQMNTFRAEFVYNMGRANGLLLSTNKKITMLGYTGIGYTLHSNPGFGYVKAEQILPVNLGTSFVFAVNQNLSLNFDVEAVTNFQQDIRFDGEFVDKKLTYGDAPIGGALNFSFGMFIYLGGWDTHADFN